MNYHPQNPQMMQGKRFGDLGFEKIENENTVLKNLVY